MGVWAKQVHWAPSRYNGPSAVVGTSNPRTLIHLVAGAVAEGMAVDSIDASGHGRCWATVICRRCVDVTVCVGVCDDSATHAIAATIVMSMTAEPTRVQRLPPHVIVGSTSVTIRRRTC